MLSFAVADLGQQIECVERVLALDPAYGPAHTRLAKLKQMRAAPPPSLPIERRPAPHPIPQERPAPRKATSEWVLPVAVGSMLMCLMAVVFAVILAVKLPAARAAPSLAYGPSPTSQPFFLFQDGNVGTSEGDMAPDFTLNTLDDQPVKLSAYRGRPVLLFFWATWCHYCKEEMPSIQEVYQAYKSSGLAVLAVEVGENASDGRAFRKNSGYTFPILNDSRSQVFSLYDGTGFPTNYFIDAEGRIDYVAVGMLDGPSLTRQVRALLGFE